MNHADHVTLADAINRIRPDWNQAGIIAALRQLPPDLSYSQAMIHTATVAANPNSRNPAAITATPITARSTPTRRHTGPAMCDHGDGVPHTLADCQAGAVPIPSYLKAGIADLLAKQRLDQVAQP
jgi:hypothetical protein